MKYFLFINLILFFLSGYFIFHHRLIFWILQFSLILNSILLLFVYGRLRKSENIFIFGFFAVLIFFTFAILITVNHFKSFYLVETDYSAMAEVILNTTVGNFRTHFHGNPESANYLAHHFSPGLVLLTGFLKLSHSRLGYAWGLLFYHIWSIIIFILILKKLKLSKILILVSIILFLLNPYLHTLFFAYHFESILLTIFLIGIYFLERKKSLFSILFFCICLTIKEDIPIYFIFFSITLITEKNTRRVGVVIGLISIFYYFLVIPYFQAGVDQSARIDWMGEMFSHKDLYQTKTIQKIILNSFSRIPISISFFISFAFLPFFYPRILITLIPIFFIHFISERPWHNTVYNYYAYTVLPFLVYGYIKGLKNVSLYGFRNEKIAGLVFILIAFTFYKHYNSPTYPMKFREVNESRLENIRKAVSLLPEGSSVQVAFDMGVFVPISNRIFPIKNENFYKDFVFLDLENGFSPFLPLTQLKLIVESNTKGYTPVYRAIYDKDGVVLLRKNE